MDTGLVFPRLVWIRISLHSHAHAVQSSLIDNAPCGYWVHAQFRTGHRASYTEWGGGGGDIQSQPGLCPETSYLCTCMSRN